MRRLALALVAASFAAALPGSAALLEGTVKDKESGVGVTGALVTVMGTGKSVRTGEGGRFSLEGIGPGRHAVKVESPGFLPFVVPAVPFNDERAVQLKIGLRKGILVADEQVVSADKPSRLAQVETSKRSFTGDELRKVAGARGDPILAIANTAGVKSGGFSGAPVVRGGSPNDNKYFIDDIQIGNPYHFGGLVSVFNANTIAKVDFYSGALPARFGNAMSAVIDVETKAPKNDALHGVLESNLLYSEGLIEGPILPGIGFALATRRSYIDAIVGRFLPEGTIFPFFQDYQAKVSGALPAGGRVELVGIGALDQANLVVPAGPSGRSIGNFSFDSGYRSTGATWRQPIGEGVSNRFVANYQEPFTDLQLGRFINIQDFRYWWTFANDLIWQANEQHQLRTGMRYDTVNYVARRTTPDFRQLPGGAPRPPGPGRGRTTPPTPEELDALPKLSTDTFGNQKIYGVYVEDAWKPIEALTLSMGLRYDRLQSTNDDDVGPRLGASWRYDPDTTLRLAYGQQFQFASDNQLLPGSGNPALRSQFSKDYVVGVDRQFNEFLLGKFEVYYRNLFGLVVRDDVTRLANNGAGKSYGLETTLELAENQGWSGTLALTLARAFRERVGKAEIPYEYDQPIVANLLLGAPKIWDWTPSLKLRYSSGRPYTAVVGRTQNLDGTWSANQGDENGSKFPDGLTWSARFERPLNWFGWDDEFYLEVTQQREVLAVDYGADFENFANPTFNYGLPPIPYFGYRVKF